MKIALLVARVIAVAALIVLAAPFAWERITGDYFMTVTGPSMRPTYEIGDVLVVAAPTGTELQTADQIVVASTTPGNKAEQYVHRVHEITADGTVLKGDGNEIADPTPIVQTQVMGTPRLALHGPVSVGYHLTQNIFGRVALIALIAPAFLFSAPGRTAKRGRRRAEAVGGADRSPADVELVPALATADGVDVFDTVIAGPANVPGHRA